MNIRATCRLSLVAFAAFSAAPLVHAADVLDHLPGDALGFVRLNQLGATDAKIGQLSKTLRAPLPGPLAFLKMATGLGDGIDREGDALLAFLPDESDQVRPVPLVMLPVSDYGQFVEAIQGDVSGEICRVAIAGEDVLVAQKGSYALVMNLENRSQMERLLPLKPEAPAGFAPVREWLAANEIAVMILPSGVDQAIGMGRAGLKAQQQQFAENFGDSDMQDMLQQLQSSLQMYDQLLGVFGAEVDAVGIGLSIDDQQNLRLGKRVLLESQGQLAQLPATSFPDKSYLRGYADQPYVAVGGGPTPEEWTAPLSEAAQRMMQNYPALYSLEGLDDEDWEKAKQSWLESMQGVRGFSMLLYAGKEDDPIYSNVFGVIDVEDSQKYLQSYRKSIEAWNELFAQSTGDMKFEYEVSNIEIAGREGLLLKTDLLEMLGPQDNVQFMKPMFEKMFGPEGVMRAYIVPVDAEQVVFGIASEEAMQAVLQQVASGEESLAKSQAIATTQALLDDQAPWQGFVSPRGMTQWITRWLDALGTVVGGRRAAPEIPAFPESPPLGLSAKISDGVVEADMVIPAAALEALSSYIQTIQQDD